MSEGRDGEGDPPGEAPSEDAPTGRTDGDDECTLCDLPTPDPPVTDPEVEGTFCCRGCLEVHRRIGDGAAGDPDGDGTAGDPDGDEGGPTGDPDPRSVLGTGDATDGDTDPAEGESAFLSVEGMHCATCEAFLEARASDAEGVLAAEASYPSGTMKVAYDPDRTDPGTAADAVSGAGYDARPARITGDGTGEDGSGTGGDGNGTGEDPTAGGTDGSGDDSRTVVRLLVGGFFGMMAMLYYAVVLYPTYLGIPPETLPMDPAGTDGAFLLWNVWVMTTVVLGFTGAPILRGAWVSLRAGRPNMDLLVALAATTAYSYSTLALLVGRVEVYFDVTIVVIMAVSVGGYYEERIRRRAAGRLHDLARQRVATARRRTAGGTETVDVGSISAGDEVVVRPGDRIPVDGTVVEGSAAVDESLVTGESRPVRREVGDEVVGGSLATDGGLVVAVGEGARSTVDRLVEYLWEVRAGRPGVQRYADRIAAVFVPLVVVLAAVSGSVHLLLGSSPTDALLTALAVLVVSCPCALGLATPLAVAAGVRESLARGIVVTDGSVFESATDADVVALDKTGTLTTGRQRVTDVVAGDGTGDPEGRSSGTDPDREAVLARAAAVESLSDHPLAEAVADRAAEAGVAVPEVTGFERHPGRGVSGDVDGERVVVGRPDLVTDRDWTVPGPLADRYREADDGGEIPALVAWDGRARGVVVAADAPREGWRETVADLAAERRVVVITGDRGGAADRFRDHPGIDEVFAGVPPEAKAEVVERLREDGTVAMVGDGTNDAPALATADLGIALEEGTRLAADAADAVVTTGDLATVPAAFDVTAAARRRIRENLAWAFLYNAVAVPSAALGLINPLVAAVAMAASSLLVVTNSARSLGGDRGDREDDPAPGAGDPVGEATAPATGAD